MAASKELITKIILKAHADGSISKAFSALSKNSDTCINKLTKIGDKAKTAFKVVGTAVAAGAVAAGKAAIDFESAFAGVKKTVDETDTTSYEKLSDGIRQMAKVTPAAATEIADVAAAAGQLGIKADDVLSFSKVMIDLGESTNLTSDEAATSIAKLFNVTGTSMNQVSNFGSTLVALGNNAATTESDILAMAMRIAGSGKQIGLTEQQILALSTSLSSVGIEAQMGGSAISTTMSEIDKAVALNDDTLSIWAKTAGLSVSKFSELWKTDAYGAMQKVMKGMADTKAEGGNLNVLLDDLGITAIRQGDTLKRLSSATGLMSEMTDLANSSWSENLALSTEANTRYATMASRLQIAKNKITDVGITIGNALMPVLDSLMKKFDEINWDAVAQKIVDKIQWVIDNFDKVKITLGILAGAFATFKVASFINTVGGAIKELKTLANVMGMADKINTLKSSLMKFSVVQKIVTAAQSLMNITFMGCPVVWIVAAIAGLIAIFVLLWKKCDGFRNFWIGLWAGIKTAFTKAWEGITNFFTVTIPNAFNKVVDFFKNNWQSLILLIINPFAGISKLLYDNCEGFRNVVDKIVEWFKALPSKIWTFLVSVGQSIAQWGVNLWNKAKEIGSNFINGIVNFFKQLPYKIGYFIGFVIGKIILFGQKLWNFATVTIPQFIGKVVTWFAQLPGKIWTWLVNTWNKFVAWRNQMYAKALDIGKSVINAVVNFFKTLPGKVWTWLTSTIQKIATWGSNMITRMRTAAVNAINATINWFAQLPGRIWTWLVNTVAKVTAWGSQMVAKAKSAATQLVTSVVNTIKVLPGKMLSIGKDLVKGIWNGISNAKNWLLDKIKSFASGITDGIKDALGINSPSVVMEKLFKWVPVGAGNGIINNAKYAVNAVKSMGGKIATAASKINPTISTSTNLPKHGTGGTFTTPHMAVVGDRPETIVPHGNTPRNRALLSEAARGVGASSGGTVYNQFTFAPVVSGGNAEENRAMIREEEELFERRMEAWLAKNRRLAY